MDGNMMETATTSSKDAEFFQLCECKCGALAKNICTEENCAFNQIQPFYCNKGCASRNKHNHLQVTIKQVCWHAHRVASRTIGET